MVSFYLKISNSKCKMKNICSKVSEKYLYVLKFFNEILGLNTKYIFLSSFILQHLEYAFAN